MKKSFSDIIYLLQQLDETATLDQVVDSACKIAKKKDIKNPAGFISNMCKKAKSMKGNGVEFRNKLRKKLSGSMKEEEIEKLIKSIKC